LVLSILIIILSITLCLFLDGLIDENSIIEIKWPYVARETNTIIEAVENKLVRIITLI